MWSTILFPIIPAAVKIIGFMYFLDVAAKITSAMQSDIEATLPPESTDDIKAPPYRPIPLTYLHIYNAIAFVWTQFFISDVIQMTMAGTFTTWYWTFKKAEVPPFQSGSALKTTLKYHLGTVALGSLTINICLIPRVFLSLCLIKESCFRYTVSYIERFLRQFNHNAYILCAIMENHCVRVDQAHTKSFCRICGSILG